MKQEFMSVTAKLLQDYPKPVSVNLKEYIEDEDQRKAFIKELFDRVKKTSIEIDDVKSDLFSYAYLFDYLSQEIESSLLDAKPMIRYGDKENPES